MSASGAMQEGEAVSATALYKAGVAKVNKDIALQNADYEYYVGAHEAQRVGLAGRERMGQIRATQGASGLDVNFGSNQRVQESQQSIVSHDQRTVRANAARRAYGHEIEALSATHSGELYKAAATNAKTAASIKATTSLLSGAASVSSKWLGASQAGMFGKAGTVASGAHSLGGSLAESMVY